MSVLRTNYREFRGPEFRVLGKDQLDEIHSATLEVMQRTGCRVFDDEALDLLKKAGAHVSEGNLVRIPPSLVERALSTVPSRIPLCDRDGKLKMSVERRNVYFGPGSDCLYVRDQRTGERRKAALSDVVQGMQVCEAMPNIDYLMSMFMPWDVPNQVADRYQMETMLLYSRKPVVFVAWDLTGCTDAVEMAAQVAGGMDELVLRPQIACYINMSAPLRHNQEAVQKLLYMAGKGLPALYIPGIIRGTTGPMTTTGTLILANACQLAGLVMSQLKREGAPFIRGHGINTLDMKTMVMLHTNPERPRAAFDLAQYYGIPSFGHGGLSDSKVVDEQAAIEAALSILLDTLAGANLIHDIGFIESGLCGSLEMLVMTDEIISWVKQNLRPLDIDDETMAIDLIDEIGPDGHFFDTEHTMRHYRDDWYPRFLDRRNYGDWDERGQITMLDNIRSKVREIIEVTPEPILPADVARRVRAVRERAEASLSGGSVA